MRTKRWMTTCVVALLSVAAVLAKDIRVVVFKVVAGRIQEVQL